jgi:hydrogenase maturation protein HypF
VRAVALFEAQAALELEALADSATEASYPVDYRAAGDGWVVETAPLVRALVADVLARRPVPEIAGAFHNALRDLILGAVARLAPRTGVRRVALTGGVFQNALLAERAADALTRRGFEVLLHRRVPCNDGGLALGQAYVAALSSALGSGHPAESRLS